MILIPLIFLLFIVVFLTKTIISHNKRHNNLIKWSNLNKKTTIWAKEISDENIRADFLTFCLQKLIISNKDIFNLNIDNVEKEIMEKYSKHIPSLKSRIREEKINKLIYGK